ncbi:MAG: cadherin-like domain-containing protein [Gallionella sp.]|nr:cadherin-like domain-containing protein [Gallionella sp.]
MRKNIAALSQLHPVWNELKVWQDNPSTISGGASTGDGVTYTDTNHNGQTSLLVTRIDDQSLLEANRDGITGYEDTELIVSAADLDTLAGLSGQTLSLTSVSGFTHGTGYLDGNGFIHYTPVANYFGVAGFEYSLQAPTGQSATAHVELTLQNINDAPVVTVDQHLKPVYGYDAVYRWYDSEKILVRNKLGAARYTPYTGYDAKTGTTGLHDTILTWVDSDGPNQAALLVTDIDDPAGSFTFNVTAQAQKGEGAVDANGNVSYTNWYGPNTPGTAPVAEYGYDGDTTNTYPTAADPFTVTVTDAGGASTNVQIDSLHSGAYYPTLGSGGGGKKPIAIDLGNDGFGFTDVNDSNIFFDINSDGFKHRTAWPRAGDGLLTRDLNGNGLVDNGSEISFAQYLDSAQTDLQGLSAFDTNQDGLFSAQDQHWNEFGVWQDTNQNGHTDAGEQQSLNDMGIAAISLTSDGQFTIIDGLAGDDVVMGLLVTRGAANDSVFVLRSAA